MPRIPKFSLLTLGAVFLLAACESATPGSTAPETPGVSNAIHVNNAGDGLARFENLEICKTWEDPSATATDFDVTVGNDTGAGGTTTTVTRTLADGECREVAQFNGSTQPGEPGPATELTVTETVPTGAELVSITWVAVDNAGNDISGTATGAPYNVTSDVATATWSADLGDNTIGYLVTFHNRLLPTGGGEGCTPGFWKNRGLRLGWPAPYSPSDSFDATFGVTSSFGGTLLEALNRGGGDEAALMRHSAAALLNAASLDVDYDLSEAEVIALVQAAYASGEFEDAKDELEPFNEQNAAGFCE